MANELDGSGIYLIIDDEIFANERGLTNSETMDSLETTSTHSTSKRKTFITGESTGTITANGLYAVTDATDYDGYHALKTKMLAGSSVTYEVGSRGARGEIETGSAIITSLNMTANENEPATYDITLQKTGVYTEAEYSS